MIWFYISLTAFLVYLFFSFWVSLGLRRLKNKPNQAIESHRKFTIIIAAHNEEACIKKCLEALKQQNYPEAFQVILAADRCTDQTVPIAKTYQSQLSEFKIIEITAVAEGVAPKKNALEIAIQHAKYDTFLFLDADVKAHPDHLLTMNQSFQPNTAAVISLMKFETQKGIWHRFLRFEKLISWCIAGSGVGYQKPVISYGGNWGYTKVAFDAINGFSTIKTALSGDDDLLLQQFGKKGLPIGFCLAPNGWITTPATQNFKDFLRQRRRHFSAGKNYNRTLQIGYFFYHLSNLLLWGIGFFSFPASVLLLLKIMADIWVIKLGEQLFKEKISIFEHFYFNFLYMLYNTLIGPLGHLGKVRW